MQDRILTGGAPIIRAPHHVRVGRALKRIGMSVARRSGFANRFRGIGATALSGQGAMMTIGAEAIVLTPYWDSAKPPVLTIYVGHTAAAGPPDPADCWNRVGTVGEAIDLFESDMRDTYVAGVLRAFTVPLSQAQLDAAADFNYHTGAIEVANWVKLVNAGRLLEAEQSLLANWRSQPARTELERQLFFHGTYGGDGTALLVPANTRGLLNWHAASRVDLKPYVMGGRP